MAKLRQWLRKYQGVDWYNDSKATNVGAACAALQSLGQLLKAKKIIWIAGGQGKNADFAPLSASVRDYVKHALLLGEDAGLLAQTIDGWCAMSRVDDLAQAVGQAAQLAQPGDIVLLSPACASFDMFANFIERGEVFMQYVKEL